MKKVLVTVGLILFSNGLFAGEVVTFDNPTVSVEGKSARMMPTASWYRAYRLCEALGHEEFVAIKVGVAKIAPGGAVAYINEFTGQLILNSEYSEGDNATVITQLRCR